MLNDIVYSLTACRDMQDFFKLEEQKGLANMPLSPEEQQRYTLLKSKLDSKLYSFSDIREFYNMLAKSQEDIKDELRLELREELKSKLEDELTTDEYYRGDFLESFPRKLFDEIRLAHSEEVAEKLEPVIKEFCERYLRNLRKISWQTL